MPADVGANGFLGVAYEQLTPPVQAAATTTTSGGTHPTAAVYRYLITAINAQGETTVSNEITAPATGAGSTNTVTVNWGAVTGATGYKIYRTAAGGAAGSELLLTTVGLVTTYIDTAPGAPAGTYPTGNTAGVPGIYVAPTKFAPIINESVKFVQDNYYRRPIRQTADVVGAHAGTGNVEGSVQIEGLEDVVPYFLTVGRYAVTKSNVAANYTHIFTPTAVGQPIRTMSVTIVRNGVAFGYTGVNVVNQKWSLDNGALMVEFDLIGANEASVAVPTPTWVDPTTQNVFGAGDLSVEVPSGTPILDSDGFELNINDNGQPNPRIILGAAGRGSAFTSFGERDAKVSLTRDFTSRADYDAFKAMTAQSLTLVASKGANNKITFLCPVTFKDSYEVGLSGQGELIRAQLDYTLAIDNASKSHLITILSQEALA